MTNSRVFSLATFFVLLFTRFSWAVSFEGAQFYDPSQYLTEIKKDPQHPAHLYADELKKSFAATVLIPGRGTGVIISPDGWMVTAFHVIKDIYVAETETCPKLSVILNHEMLENSEVEHGVRLPCAKIAVANFNNDFALIKLAVPVTLTQLPFAPIETDENELSVGQYLIAAGHPHASSFAEGVKKISEGEMVLYEPHNPELPHFLHVVNTEAGNSGSPLFNVEGKVVGLHFRGVSNYGTGVNVIRNGQPEVTHRFNVALPMPNLYSKFVRQFLTI